MRRAKVFMSGNSQAVRLPKDFRVAGSEVFVTRQGPNLVLIPVDDPWAGLAEAINHFSEDFMPRRERPQGRDRRDSL